MSGQIVQGLETALSFLPELAVMIKLIAILVSLSSIKEAV